MWSRRSEGKACSFIIVVILLPLSFSSLPIQILWLFHSFSRTSLSIHCSFSTLLLVELHTLFNCTYQSFAVSGHTYHTFGSTSPSIVEVITFNLFKMQLPTKTLLALMPFFLQVKALASGTGTTTRYWDCCKPSCAWPGKAELASVLTDELLLRVTGLWWHEGCVMSVHGLSGSSSVVETVKR